MEKKLPGGPQPSRVTPPRSVACCATRRCVAVLGRPAACIASRLVQPKAARWLTTASRLSTSERRALRSSPLRCGIWPSRYVQSLTSSRALCSAMSCSAASWTPRAAGSRERADGASRASSTAPYGPQPQLAVARHTKSRAPNAASCCFAVWSPRAARGKAARRAAVVDQPQSAAVRHSLRAARCNQLPCVTH